MMDTPKRPSIKEKRQWQAAWRNAVAALEQAKNSGSIMEKRKAQKAVRAVLEEGRRKFGVKQQAKPVPEPEQQVEPEVAPVEQLSGENTPAGRMDRFQELVKAAVQDGDDPDGFIQAFLVPDGVRADETPWYVDGTLDVVAMNAELGVGSGYSSLKEAVTALFSQLYQEKGEGKIVFGLWPREQHPKDNLEDADRYDVLYTYHGDWSIAYWPAMDKFYVVVAGKAMSTDLAFKRFAGFTIPQTRKKMRAAIERCRKNLDKLYQPIEYGDFYIVKEKDVIRAFWGGPDGMPAIRGGSLSEVLQAIDQGRVVPDEPVLSGDYPILLKKYRKLEPQQFRAELIKAADADTPMYALVDATLGYIDANESLLVLN